MEIDFSREKLLTFVALLIATVCAESALAEGIGVAPIAFPASFKGEDCTAVAKTAKKMFPAKDEFETTITYTERLNSALYQAQESGPPLAESRFYVDSELVESTYDADAQKLMVRPRSLRSVFVSKESTDAPVVVLRSSAREESSYVGENAYGARATINRMLNEFCGLAILSPSPQAVRESISQVAIRLSPDRARTAKPNLALVYEARLTTPAVVLYSVGALPTLGNPVQHLHLGDVLTVWLIRFYVINRQTGEILATLSP